MDHKGTKARRLFAACLLLIVVAGCPQAPGSNSPGKLDSSPKTLRGLIAQRLVEERTERAELAASIRDDIRSGKLKEPAQYGEAWNKGDAAIGRKTSEVVSGLLKQAFSKASHDKVWDEVGKSYR